MVALCGTPDRSVGSAEFGSVRKKVVGRKILHRVASVVDGMTVIASLIDNSSAHHYSKAKSREKFPVTN
jgi:hypothetical protein